jgi:hypothetical protein
MQTASYDQAIHRTIQFSGVSENDPPPYGAKPPKTSDNEDEALFGTEESLYEEVLQLLEDKYLEERSPCVSKSARAIGWYTPFPKLSVRSCLSND